MNQPLYESVPPPCLMSVVTRYPTRSPSGPLNVRYARPMSNLFGDDPPFAAFAASSVWYWKSPKTQAEKSSPGVAGFAVGGGGAGLGESGDFAVSVFVLSGVVYCARAARGVATSDTATNADQNELVRIIRVS